MRILNDQDNKKLDNVTIYLTSEEAQELLGSLKDLIKNREHYHTHISSADYQKEITVCVYNVNNLSDFDERSKKLIKEDI